MSKKTHKIAPEVKAEILRRVKEEGVSVSQASQEHGVTTTTIYTWLGAGVNSAPSWSEFSRLKREKDDLLRLLGDLTVRLSTAQKKIW
ncbi:MAG: transposase [bacterium]|nr:transposase [bacterium]MDZ4284427.1 transposase [Patescibacteria group bacterium]